MGMGEGPHGVCHLRGALLEMSMDWSHLGYRPTPRSWPLFPGPPGLPAQQDIPKTCPGPFSMLGIVLGIVLGVEQAVTQTGTAPGLGEPVAAHSGEPTGQVERGGRARGACVLHYFM